VVYKISKISLNLKRKEIQMDNQKEGNGDINNIVMTKEISEVVHQEKL
jgi:hypothetical protein